MILNNRKANNDNVIDEVEEIVYVDESKNLLTLYNGFIYFFCLVIHHVLSS